jgi:hypothetical protein
MIYNFLVRAVFKGICHNFVNLSPFYKILSENDSQDFSTFSHSLTFSYGYRNDLWWFVCQEIKLPAIDFALIKVTQRTKKFEKNIFYFFSF